MQLWKHLQLAGFLALGFVLTASAIPVSPSNLTVAFSGPTSLTLSWTDNSTDELGYAVYYRVGYSGTFSVLASLPPSATSLNLSGTPPGTTCQFVVVAYDADGDANSPLLQVTTPGITSRDHEPAVLGQSFAYTIVVSNDGGAPDSVTVTGTLPTGVTFDSATRRISGTPTQAGIFTLTNTVHYPDPALGTFTKPLTLRVIYPPGPPVVTGAIPNQTLAAGGSSASVALNNFFTDRDTEKAVRFITTKGMFDVALYASATPLTVTNFLNYVNRGDYSNSLIHRSMPGVIVQGGGFKPAAPNFTAIATDPSPLNEPGVANLRGTIAMAKRDNNPNSATDQWFLNLADNTANLDNQNGGFTAFGRVCGNGLDVADTIASLPTASYTVPVNSTPTRFDDFPVDTAPPAPAALDFAKLLLVTSVTPIEPLSYAVTANTGSAALTATITGTNLVLTPTGIFGGTNLVTVTATDLDGNPVAQTFTVVVTSAYADWALANALTGTNALPAADPERDGLPNAVEFALVGSPALNDATVTLPRATLVATNGQRFPALAFKLRKNLSGITVTLSAATDLSGAPWISIWSGTDLIGPQVFTRTDQGDHWQLTIRDAQAITAGPSLRFLLLTVTVPP